MLYLKRITRSNPRMVQSNKNTIQNGFILFLSFRNYTQSSQTAQEK